MLRTLGKDLFTVAFQKIFKGVSRVFIAFRPIGAFGGGDEFRKDKIHTRGTDGFPIGSVQRAEKRMGLVNVAREDPALTLARFGIGVVSFPHLAQHAQEIFGCGNQTVANDAPRAGKQKIAVRFPSKCVGRGLQKRDPLRIGREFFVKSKQKIAEITPGSTAENMIHAIGKPIASQTAERTFFAVCGDGRFVSPIKIGDQRVHRFAGERIKLVPVGNAERRREAETLEIRSHDLLKESVDGGDLSASEQEQLFGKTRISGVGGKRLSKSFCDAAFQFRRGGARKRHDQDFGYADRIGFVKNAADDAFGQYACFAGACGSGDQK